MNERLLQDLRPTEIIFGYWKQVLAIEEDAIMLPVEYIDIEEALL